MWKERWLVGFLKNLYDQLFTAERLTRRLCSDPLFRQRIGFDEVPAPEHVLRLKQHIQFVLAMYNTAKSIFEKHVELETDAKLSLLMISRFHMLPGVRHPTELSDECLEELKLTTGWRELNTEEKFFAVCKYVFAQEMKIDMKPIAANPFFAKDEVIELLSQSIISEILAAVFEEIPWGIRENGREITRTKTWSRFSDQFVKSLRERLGTEKFDSLTLLAEKHHLFDQDIFAHPEDFTDIHNELTNVEIACLLTSMGNELYKRQIVEDAEEAYRVVIALRPEHFAARGNIAAICYDSGRVSEAKEHALRSLADMDIQRERYKDIEMPKDFADPNAVDSYRSLLQLIAESEKSD